MTTYSNSFEGGTPASTITTGNSAGASGTAFGNIVGGPIYDTTHVAHGSVAAKLTPVSGAACAMQMGAIGSGWGSQDFAARFYIYWTGLPSTTYTLFRANDDAAASAQMLRLNVDNLGKLILTYGNGTTTVTPWTSTTAIPQNQIVRIETRIEKGAGTGFVAAAFYSGDSGTAIDSYTSASTLTTGVASITNCSFGKYGTDTSATAFWIDDVKVDTAATAFIGPVSNIPPTLTLTGNQDLAAGVTVGVAATAADADGSIVSYTWSVIYCSTTPPTLTGLSTANITFTNPPAGNLTVLQCTVTDDQGATATATTEVRSPISGNFTTLPMDGTGDTWSNVGGAATEGDALADASDTTYVESPSFTGTASTHKFRLQPLVPRTALSLSSRTRENPTATGTLSVKLYDDGTLFQTWTVTPGTSFADQSLPVTAPNTIAHWSRLFVEYSAAT